MKKRFKKQLSTALLGLSLSSFGFNTLAQAETLRVDLPQALQAAQHNYDSQGQQWQVASQQAGIEQARQVPNPTVQLSFENLPSLTGDAGEINMLWQQGVNLAQNAQIALAEHSYAASRYGFQLQQLTLQRDVTQAFYALLMWQAYRDSLKRLAQVSAQRVELLQAQYNQGKALRAEYNRARLAQSELALQQQTSTLQWRNAQRQLAQYLNRPQDLVAEGELVVALNTGPLGLSESAVQARLQQHPLLQQASAQQQQAHKNKAVQEAMAWQSPSWGVGLRLTPSAADVGALAQVNVPLPVWHQNQGAIAVSQYQHKQAETQVQNTAFSLNNRWQNQVAQYQQVRANLDIYQQQLLPLARENVKLSQTAYQYGKQSYLELLDAQRSLIALEQSYLQSWGQYHQLRAELAFLLSGPVP